MTTPIPTPNESMGAPKKLDAAEDLSSWMAELDASDSVSLTDSAVGVLLNCADETDSAAKAAQLEAEMVKSLAKLERANATDPGEEPPPVRP